ncbi:MAG: hydroxymethylbilane synthase [Thermodesulfobacteriota bacterium]
MQDLIRIGTRGSQLAVAQSADIKKRIENHYPDVRVELVKIVTKGDKIIDVPLAKVGGKGLFVKEIEEAMLRGEIDLAVHSMKDVPAELPDELHLGIITRREDPRDAFISLDYAGFDQLPDGARVGTSSLRRRSQLINLRSDLVIEDLRGNLDTRLRKLAEGRYDAVILASAGLNRLNMSDKVSSYFSVSEMLPAVGQGAVGIELRRADKELLAGLDFMADPETAVTVIAERAFLDRLEGGCQVPIGAFAELKGDKLFLNGLIAAVDGSGIIREEVSGPADDPSGLGRFLAERLLDLGGKEILADVYGREMG